ncbi:MAG: DUF58 domain-containing protein, partial [Gammaproteobacteria bacterium]
VVDTTYPFGLFRAWSWVYMPLRVLVYPAPATDAPPLPLPAGNTGVGRSAAQGEDDFAGLRDYRAGDSPRRIAWKASARENRLLTKQFSGSGPEIHWLDFGMLAMRDPEARLAVLCRWVLLAHAEDLEYGLKLPGKIIGTGRGDLHRDACLRALALYGHPQEPSA